MMMNMRSGDLGYGMGYLGPLGDLIFAFPLYFNVKDYGATGDGVTDDRAAIQACITAADAAHGVVFVPEGRYRCNVLIGIGVFTISGEAAGRLLFLGCGGNSKLVMSGNGGGGDKRFFDIKSGAKWIGWMNLHLEGELTNESEQQHLLHFENPNASADLLTGKCFVIDCTFGHVRGDHIRVLGNNTKRVSDVIVVRTYHSNTGNAVRTRTALSWQRAADRVFATSFYVHSTKIGSIDFEPTGGGDNRENHLRRGHLHGEFSFSGNGSEEHRRSIVSGCVLRGTFAGLDIEDMTFKRSIIDFRDAATGTGCMGLIERIHRCVVSTSIMYRVGDNAVPPDTKPPATLAIDSHSVGDNYDITITRNILTCDNNLKGGGAISLREHKRTNVTSNLLRAKVNTADEGFCIRSESPVLTESDDDNLFSGNMMIGTGQSLQFGMTVGDGNMAALENLARGCNRACLVGGQTQHFMVARNMLLGATTGLSVLGSTPPYCAIEGGGSLSSPNVYVLLGVPTLDAAIGSIGFRTNGGIGSTMYVKEAAGTTWAVK